MNKGSLITLLLCIFTLFLTGSCKKTASDPIPKPSGRVKFSISHCVNGVPIQYNTADYLNAAGNQYMITGLKYFISDITFYKNDGSTRMISDWEDKYYVDENIPESKEILFYDRIGAGEYDSVSFIFGFTKEKNQSFMYVNPPEVWMSWPEVLGGGYHYMMLDGRWKDTTGVFQSFNFHLGIGQLYHGPGYNTDSIYAFVQNYFRVGLPASNFFLNEGDTADFKLVMNIERWFDNPYVYDHNQWGGAIMQNQPAMQMAKENGWDVFSLDGVR
jgi:hypothetical protein